MENRIQVETGSMERKSYEGKTLKYITKKITVDLRHLHEDEDEESSVEEKAETTGVYKYLEEALQKILDGIRFDLRFENNGIGSYEYWGAPGFDRGTDYLEIEDEDTKVTVKILLGEFSAESARLLLWNCCLFNREIEKDDESIKIKFEPKFVSGSDKELEFILEPIEDN